MRRERLVELGAICAPFVLGIPIIFLYQHRNFFDQNHHFFLNQYHNFFDEKPTKTPEQITNICEAEIAQVDFSSAPKERIRFTTNCRCRFINGGRSKEECEAAKKLPPEAYSVWRTDLTFANAQWGVEVAHLCQLEAEKRTDKAAEQIALDIECQCRHPLNRLDIQQCQINRKSQADLDKFIKSRKAH